MLVGKAPFESVEVKQTYSKIRVGVYSFPPEVDVHPLAKSFICECLNLDPLKRISPSEMLQHDYLSRAAIPKQMPISMLVSAPTEAFSEQFALPNEIELVLK